VARVRVNVRIKVRVAEQTGTTGTTIRNVNTTIRKLRRTVYGRGKCMVGLSLALGWGYI